MIPIRFQFFVWILVAGVFACGRTTTPGWMKALPASAPIVIIPAEHPDIASLLRRDYIQWLDQLTPARVSDIQAVDFERMGIKKAEAIVLLPIGATDWAPLWVMGAPIGTLETMGLLFETPAPVSSYQYERETVFTYTVGDLKIVAAQMGTTLVMSVNSASTEAALRAYKNKDAAYPARNKPEPGSILVQSQMLHTLLGLETLADYQAAMAPVFTGLAPLELHVDDIDRATGELNFTPARRSAALRALTSTSATPDIDAYIPADAILYAQLNGLSALSPSEASLRSLSQALDPRFGFTHIPTTTSAVGDEGVFVRLLTNAFSAEAAITALANRGQLEPVRDMYRIRNDDITRLISGDIATSGDYHLKLVGNVAYLSKRPGVISRVAADHARSRTLAQDEAYRSVREEFATSVTGFLFVRSEGLTRQLQPWLHPENRVDRYINRFDILASSFTAVHDSLVTTVVRFFTLDESTKPVVDGWSTNLDGYGISGPATLTDITGDGQDDVVVATTGGRLYGFGTDGIELFSIGIGSDGVQGSPIVADWFSNGDLAILVGAADSIHAWNTSGSRLPNFPIALRRPLSAPPLVADLRGRGTLELVVSTDDQTIAILDRLGRPLAGWPQRMRDIATTTPVSARIFGKRAILTYADDVLHAWDLAGKPVPGFPVTLPSPATGDILIEGNHVLVGTIDGELVAIGTTGYFASARTRDIGGGLRMQTLRSASQSLRLAGVVGDRVAGIGQQGEVRVFDRSGKLVYSHEMYVTMSPARPMMVDINHDGNVDLVAGSTYGRVYAWDVVNGVFMDVLPAYTCYEPAFSTRFGPDAVPYMVSDSPDGIRVWRLQGQTAPEPVSSARP